VTQGDNTVRADEIRFARKTGALTATGNVSGDFRGETKDSGKKGIHLTQAKKWTLDPVQHLHQLEGDVALSMEDTKIKASKIRLYMDEANQGILRAESDPPLEISQADLWATADSAIYYPATPSSEEQLVLRGNAKLNQGQNFMSGEEITFFPRTGTMGGKGVHVTVEVNEEQEIQP
jgi:lipopolysaccharide transport protein LptA